MRLNYEVVAAAYGLHVPMTSEASAGVELVEGARVPLVVRNCNGAEGALLNLEWRAPDNETWVDVPWASLGRLVEAFNGGEGDVRGSGVARRRSRSLSSWLAAPSSLSPPPPKTQPTSSRLRALVSPSR